MRNGSQVTAAACACLFVSFLSNALAQPAPSCGNGTDAAPRPLTGVALAATRDGTLYFADRTTSLVRKITPAGVIANVAGTGTPGFAGDGGNASAGQIGLVAQLSVDGSGNLFIAEASPGRVRKVTPGGTITTVAGSGRTGFEGDGGPATSASLCTPAGMALDGSGNLYLGFEVPGMALEGDRGYRVRRVTPAGIITTVADAGTQESTTGGSAAADVTPARTGPARVTSLTAHPDGTLYFSDGARIRRMTPGGTITIAAGTGRRGVAADGLAAASSDIGLIVDVEIDDAGNLLFSEGGSNRIRTISRLGILGTMSGSEPGAPGSPRRPRDLATDGAGNVFFVERLSLTGSPPDNQAWLIRKLTRQGAASTLFMLP
jgi:hypothetical protein